MKSLWAEHLWLYACLPVCVCVFYARQSGASLHARLFADLTAERCLEKMNSDRVCRTKPCEHMERSPPNVRCVFCVG